MSSREVQSLQSSSGMEFSDESRHHRIGTGSGKSKRTKEMNLGAGDVEDEMMKKRIKSAEQPSENVSEGDGEGEVEGDLESVSSKEEEGEKKGKGGRGGRGTRGGRGKGKVGSMSTSTGTGRGKSKGKGRGKVKAMEEQGGEEEKEEEKTKTIEKETTSAGAGGGSNEGVGTGSGAGEEEKVSSKPKSKRGGRISHPQARETDVVIEKGKLYFFYRPKVELQEAHSPSEVQRLYMIMAVTAEGKYENEEFTDIHGSMDAHVSEAEAIKFRLAILASKRLPEPTYHSRAYAFIQTVSEKVEEVAKALDKQVYSTATRGDRHLDACRACGEAVYEIVLHKNTSHLIYLLELPTPEHFGSAQTAFGLHEVGNILIQVKNPSHPQADQRMRGGDREFVGGVKDKPKFPKELQQFFSGKRVDQLKFAPILSSQLLDFPHAEMVLIGNSKNMEEEFPDIAAELEKEEDEDFNKMDKETQHEPEKSTLEELHMKDQGNTTEPLKKGELV